MRRRLLRAWIALLLCFWCTIPSAQAKDVRLEWEDIEGTITYMLEIWAQSGSKPLRVLTPKKHVWKGDLPFGIYTYRIRGVDRAERPGDWSEMRPLVVLPGAPKAVFPKDGTKIEILEKNDPKVFKWERIAQAQEYKLKVVQDGVNVINRTVEGTQTDLRELGPGKYSWSVRPVIKAENRALASLIGRQWDGSISDSSEFEIAYRRLDEPDAIAPVGAIAPDTSGKLRFTWKKVNHVKIYEVTLEKERNDEEPGTPPSLPEVFRVSSNNLSVKLPEMGNYRWKVRALASVSATSPLETSVSESNASFELSSDPDDGKGYIGLSALFAPYQYSVQTPSGKGMLDSQSLTLRLAGETSAKRGWGIGGGLQNTTATIQGSNYSWMDFEVYGKYRISLSNAANGLFLLPKAGFERRQYLFVAPDGSGTPVPGQALSSKTASTIGPAIGFDVRKQLGRQWSLGLKVTYYKPILLSGVETGAKISGERNLSIGIQGFYWYAKRWGIGLGAFIDRKSFGYDAPTSGHQEVNLDSTQLFMSILFRI